MATRPLLAAEQAIELCTRRRIQAALECQVLVAALSELSRDVCVHGIHLADQHVTRETGHRDSPHGRTNRAVRRDHGGASRLQAGIRDQTLYDGIGTLARLREQHANTRLGQVRPLGGEVG